MYKHILVPVDLGHGEVGEHILNVAKFLAAGTGKITLLTVREPIPGYVAAEASFDEIDRAHAAEAREKLAAVARSAGVEARAVLRTGRAPAEILDEAKVSGCDAIILGSHRPDFRDYFIGSTAARVVRYAQCTVVVERSGPLTAP